MIEISELIKFINHEDFTPELAKECLAIYNEKNLILELDELGNVIEKEKNSSFDDYELLNPSAVIEFYKESLIEKNNDTPEYKNKINLLEDIQDYCFSREESEAEFEREITYSNKSNLDLQEGFWTSTDGYKTKVHISTNYLSDEYVRLITSYERRENKVKNYIDNLIAKNPNESYITISINPTTEEIEFTLNGINNGNLINLLKYDYKFHLIKDLSKLLYNVDTIDNSTTNEYKQQIGSNFEKYKEIVDSVIVEGLINSIYDIHKDDLYTSDEEHDCRYYCEFYGNYLDVYQDIDKNSEYRIGLVFNKKQECVDYFITRIRIIDGNVDYDIQKELSPYNKEIFRIAENKIKNLVLQKFHTQELYNISKYIDWSGFTEEMFNKFKNELLTGNEKPDWKGSINVGSVSIEISQYEKTEENPWLDYKVFVLGENNGYEYDNSIPYAFYEGNQFAINMITENSYEEFKNKFTELIINDIKEKNIQNSEHVKKEMMRPTIDWNNQEQSKQLYFEKLNGKKFYKTETLSNANELKFIINSLEPALDFKKSDAEIVLDYLLYGDYLSFENNTLKYKGDDGKAYGENLFDVLNYIEANIQEHIENITMNIEYGSGPEEEQGYLKILKEQVLPSIQNKCNILRLKEVEAASRMIMSNVNDFGYFSVQNYDELFEKEDGTDYRFTLCEAAAKELIDRKISDFSQVEEYIKNKSKEVFKNECLKELEKQTFLDDVEKMVDLSIDSLDKDDYLDTYSYVTEEEYDRTKYLFDNFYKIENQTGSIDLKALYDSKESVDNVVTLENGAEIRKVIESDEGEEREYYDLYDKNFCSICDGENYEVKAEINGTYYLKGLDSEYEDSGFALSTDEYLIATQRLGLLKEKSLQHEKEVEVLWNKGILLFKDTKYWEDILTETPADSKENENLILSKLHSKFRQEIVDKFNPNENINWENESWNYICETMQRKSLDYDYSVNYVNGLTSKDLQDFIANDFVTIKMNLQDKEMESLWEELEDIPFIEDEDGRLILDSDESWHNFEPGTTKEEIWHYFDRNHSKGINYLVNEYESKTKELQEQTTKDGYEAGYSGEYELNDLTQEKQESKMYKKIHTRDSDGFERWTEYDNKGNEIHFKNSDGFEKWTEYDENGNVIHYKNSNGVERWTEYDNKGNEIYYKNSDGFERWTEYDEKGNVIHFKNSIGFEHWKEYDDKGNVVHYKDSEGYEGWKEYDDKGNEIHHKLSSGLETWSTVEYVSKEQYLQEKIEQSKKEGYEAGVLLENDESILSLKELKPMQIVEEISREEFNIEKDFRSLLLDNMKTTNNPFVATHKIFEELKQKNDTERIKEFNNYLQKNNCTTKKGFETFYSEIIGLTKKDTERKIRKKKQEYEQHER